MALPDYLAPGLDVVFCGTAAGTRTAGREHYYPEADDKFWDILVEASFVKSTISCKDDAAITQHRIGLSELVKIYDRDVKVKPHEMFDIDGFKKKIAGCAPRVLAFNGKKSAQRYLGRKRVSYGLQTEALGATKLYVLPSTSAAASDSWDAKPWVELKKLLK